MAYFELRTARDMLEKACREHKRLHREFNIDNVFNFFVTAYHICDYLKTTGIVPAGVVQDLEDNDPDINACRDLCNKGKHLRLTHKSPSEKFLTQEKG